MFIFEADSHSLKNNRTIGSVTLPCIITYVHYLLNVAWWFYEKKTTHFLFYLLLRLFLKVRITDIVYTCPSHNFSIVLRIAYYIIVFTKKRGQEEGHRLTSVLKNVNNRFQGKNYVTHFRTYPSEYFRIGHSLYFWRKKKGMQSRTFFCALQVPSFPPHRKVCNTAEKKCCDIMYYKTAAPFCSYFLLVSLQAMLF